MKYKFEIIQFHDRKCKQLIVYDKEENIHYPIAYFTNEKRVELFLECFNGYFKELKIIKELEDGKIN